LSNPDDARARRQRLLRRAFGNLGTFPSPAAPQGTVPVASETPTPTPTPASSPIPAASRPPAPPSPPKAWASSTSTTDDTALARTIEAKAAQLKGDHFAVLGIPRTATHDQVKAAYLQLVKTFHPDHLPSSLSHLSQQVKDIFTGVREAYDTLLDDARREVYLKQITRPAEPAPATKNESAVDALEKQAELHLRKKEYARAAEVFAKAFALSDSAGLLAQQAWCIYLDPARKADLPKVKQMLDQALLKDPLCDKAAYALGVLARVEGDLAKAEKHFKTALAGNPRHAEAATELRLIERRRKKT
jgi:tetratricopeptide (TPR) repeat protein